MVTLKTTSEEVRTVTPAAMPTFGLSYRIAFAIIGAITAALFLAILKINHGTFTYTLDDPYIHLALSSQILHGNYGIHAGQYAAPSSSILFPFLLAAAAGTRLHPYLPLILNVAALFLTIEIIRRFFVHLELARDNIGAMVLAGGVVLMAICLNIIGVVFTGLEHSLHVASVAAIIYGLARFLDERKMPAWLPAAIVLCPLLRYEGLPLSLAAIAVLAIRGKWRAAAITFAVVFLLVAGFSVFLITLGLGPLPSSVLMKSTVAADGVAAAGGNFIASMIINAIVMCGYRAGFLLLLAGAAAGARCLLESPAKPRDWTSQGLMSMVLFCMVAGHAMAGQFGRFYRYEVYILVGAVLIGVYLMQKTIRGVLGHSGDRRLVLVLAATFCFLLATASYIQAITLVPIAANNIFEQQFQMHRFVKDFYRAPVAVNDLGLVSYRNPYFVLDLGGLASRKARIMDLSKPDPTAYDALLRSSGVHLAIIYDEIFVGRIPGDWQKIGTMDLSRPAVSSAESDLQFYATDPATAIKARIELANFQKTLPSGVKLVIH